MNVLFIGGENWYLTLIGSEAVEYIQLQVIIYWHYIGKPLPTIYY